MRNFEKACGILKKRMDFQESMWNPEKIAWISKKACEILKKRMDYQESMRNPEKAYEFPRKHA